MDWFDSTILSGRVQAALRSDIEDWIEFLASGVFMIALNSLHSAMVMAKYLALRLLA
jgi:hypothetical protein